LVLSCDNHELRVFIPLQSGFVSKPLRAVSLSPDFLYESHVDLLSGGGPDGGDGSEIPIKSVTGLDGIPGIPGIGLEPPPPMMF
jgi:hypothetical protein